MVETQSRVCQRTAKGVTYSLSNTIHLQIDLKDPQFLPPVTVHLCLFLPTLQSVHLKV